MIVLCSPVTQEILSDILRTGIIILLIASSVACVSHYTYFYVLKRCPLLELLLLLLLLYYLLLLLLCARLTWHLNGGIHGTPLNILSKDRTGHVLSTFCIGQSMIVGDRGALTGKT